MTLKFLREHPGILLKMHYEIKPLHVYSLQLLQFCESGDDAHIQKFKISKKCFNTFHPVDSLFLICKFTILLLMDFSFYILLSKINEFSPWQCVLLCLISSQERANKHKLNLISNTKST